MENNGYYSGIGFEQEECDRFLVLRKLIDFDTYVPPKQVLDICSDYLRKYQTVCFTFQQAAYFLFAEIYRGDFKEDPVDKLVQCMANEKSTKIDIENARLEFKINEGIDNFKNKWKTAINAVLRVLFGNNTTIDVYRYNKSGEDEGEYAIYQDEL